VWDDEREAATRARLRKEILKALAAAEKEKKPALRNMFEDVYETMPPGTRVQMAALKSMIERYPAEYDVSEFEGGKETLGG